MAFEVLFPCTVICKRFKQIEKALFFLNSLNKSIYYYKISHTSYIYIIYKKEKGRPGGPFKKSYYLVSHLGLVFFEK